MNIKPWSYEPYRPYCFYPVSLTLFLSGSGFKEVSNVHTFHFLRRVLYKVLKTEIPCSGPSAIVYRVMIRVETSSV